ncbi:MAG: hypothetical protein GY822_08020 [Deltaproteobacteria bacterium]|nr:hypothetical protein [Deltaproteobacteria bacterium]
MSNESTADALRALGQLPPKKPLSLTNVTLHLSPREEGLQSKEISGEVLGKKLVGVRDKIRVLEQRVNASGISLEEKVALQAKVTALYGAVGGIHAFFSEDALAGIDLARDDEEQS